MRYWDLCAPCHVNYDFIGTAENYADEASLFVHQHNITVTFPEHEAKTTVQTSLGLALQRIFMDIIICHYVSFSLFVITFFLCLLLCDGV